MKTRISKLNEANPDSAKIKQAVELIDKGNLVAFPTETVYGIACRVKNDSLAKLNKLKNRTPDKHYTLHISHKKEVQKYVPTIPIRAQKLINNALPGPITIVFELEPYDISRQKKLLTKEVFENLYKDNSIGIRCPDNRIASMILEQTTNPVVAPSANITGQSPAVDAQQVLSYFSGQIALLIDGGACKYKKVSTVVKIGKQNIEILREGVYSKAKIEQMLEINFLFVCTGNSCRSPMAEALFGKYLAEKLKCDVDQLEKMGYKIDSAGTMGITGVPASIEAVRVCRTKGVDIAQHTSKALSRELIVNSDYIFVMGKTHREEIINLVPEAVDKCFLLAKNSEIADPIGQEQEIYNQRADQIEAAAKKRISELKL